MTKDVDCSLPGSSTRQENRGRLPSPGDLPDPGIEPGSAALQAVSYCLSTMLLLLLLLRYFSRVRLCATPQTATCQPSLSFTNSWSLLKLMSIELVMLSNHFILCCLLLFLPSICPSIRVFSNESVLPIRWPNYWSFSFSISPSNEYSGFISFRMDWLDLLAVQGTLKSLLQHHSSKASILWHSASLCTLEN